MDARRAPPSLSLIGSPSQHDKRRAVIATTAGIAVVLAVLGVVAVGVLSGDSTDRAERIGQQLRCPGCGPVLADADGKAADDLRKLIDDQMNAGWTDQMILDDFASRYGSWILREAPPADQPWRWALPIAAIVGGAAVAAFAPGRLVASEGRARTLALVGGGAMVIGGCLGIGVLLVGEAPEAAPPAITTEVAGLTVDPTTVSDDELEEVVAENPDIVPMRLALVERYLEAGDIEPAHLHTAIAVDIDAAPVDHQRALKFHGWTTALLGDPQAGADLLESSLLLAPEDRDAKWFLANVRLHGLGQTEAAVGILEELVESPMDDSQRALISDALEEARAAL